MRTAIIGYGKMGKYYDALIAATYIVDPFYSGQRVTFGSVDEFLDYGQPVDLVIVTASTAAHFDIVKKILTHSYNVLCEKPLTLSSLQAKQLEEIATSRSALLYQSTLERYNPIIRFFKQNIAISDVAAIDSYRLGVKPASWTSSNAMFDLGVHDVDLWFYLTKQTVPWTVHAGYTEKTQRREVVVRLKNGGVIRLDLLHRIVWLEDGSVLDFTKAGAANPMLDMLFDLQARSCAMNEAWHKEIALIEQCTKSTLTLLALACHARSELLCMSLIFAPATFVS